MTSQYVTLADQILQHAHPNVADVSPVYLWLIVGLRALGFSETAITAMQLAMLIASAALCAIVAKRYAGWPAAIATAILILGNRAAWVIAMQLDPKALIFFLVSAALAILPRSPLIAALLLGLNAVTHPYGYLMLFVVAIVHRRVAMLAAIVPIVLVLAFTPKTAKHSSVQFYEGNNILATGAGPAPPRWMRDADPRDDLYRSVNINWTEKAINGIRAYPLVALERFATKALLTIHNDDIFDQRGARETNARLPRILAIPFGLAFALAIVAVICRRDVNLFAVLAIVLMIALTLFVVSARQRNVLLVPMSILGGIGFATVLQHRRLAIPVVLVTALLYINPIDDRPRVMPGDPDVLAARGDLALLNALHDPRTVAESRQRARVSHHRP